MPSLNRLSNMPNPQFLDVPPLQNVSGQVNLPGSKSISNRALLLAALCSGARTTLTGVLDSDDTRVMCDALTQLGGQLERELDDTVHVTGLPAEPSDTVQDLYLGNAGTAMRPLVAALALRGGSYTLRGTPRMHERPIGDLVDALVLLGCRIAYLGTPGFPPLRIDSPQLDQNAPIRVRGDVSSQFLTGLLMALPQVTARGHAVRIEVVGELISKPYIDITLNLLAKFGVPVEREDWRFFTLAAGSNYQSVGHMRVEADASSATYFIAAASMNTLANSQKGVSNQAAPKGLTVVGVGAGAIQGDLAFVDAARAMGAHIELDEHAMRVRPGAWPLRALDLDCNHMPDAAMTLAVMALFADGPSTLRNIGSWRVKETDRLSAMATELRKLGAEVAEGPDWLRIQPLHRFQAASIHTYDDHRMAMCLSLAAFNGQTPVRIEDPACVKKTYPGYFDALWAVAKVHEQDIPVICVDGPTASGKGTLASTLAQQLGYHYLDSGALYRATALAALQAGCDLSDEASVARLAQGLPIRFEGADAKVWLADKDITGALRQESTGMHASLVSAHPAVRRALVELQLGFRKLPGLVTDGRDMGTLIFPGAELKVFLTASASARAQRRHKQLISKGIPANIDSLRRDLEDRDARDTQRSASPLKPSAEARHLDNSNLSIDESVQQVLAWWQQTRPF